SQNGIDFTLVWDLQDGATLECLPPTEAAFSISENLIQPGGTVDLVDLSTNFPYAWVWDLPGGSPATSYDQNPQGVMYADPGCYDVSLTAYNAAGESTLSAVCLVQVESTTGLRASDQDHFQITRQGEHWVIIPTSNARYAARLLDATGRIIQQIRSRGIIELVTTDLPVGAYLVVIEDPSTRIVRRLVKVE
ncbi:MAG TPA: PKD domain-containing protein, partial [Flavobacteriales bacterium]|nr:PKD domain-containing protein [Flavobacteriales bacterium]